MQITIISGASRGIGKAIAEDLQKHIEGAFILLSTKNVDFVDYKEVYHGTNSLLGCFGNIKNINVILCAAQVGTPRSDNLSEIDNLFKINVLGNLAVIKACMEYDVPLKIVWMAGGGAANAFPEFFGYSLSKTAVVRAVENLSHLLKPSSCIIALSPGAVDTDMLKIVEDSGAEIRTRTDISEPVKFVRDFIKEENVFYLSAMGGRYFHVRDDIDFNKEDKYLLRRIE